jgi:hypothetical protein
MYKAGEDMKGKGLGPTGAREESKEDEWKKFAPKEYTALQKGMLGAFNRYVCYIEPPNGDAEKEEQYLEVKFARARTYFEAQHWEEAALGFRDIAMNYSKTDRGIFAVQLYLESLNVLGSRTKPTRPTCYDDMAADVPRFIGLYCEGKNAEDNAEQCGMLKSIQFDILRLRAEKKVEKAREEYDQGKVTSAVDGYRAGGDAYLDLWRTYCEGPLANKESPKECERADEILYNMASAYQAGRLLGKSMTARKLLLSPKYGLNTTELAQKALYELGGNYQAIAVYDMAAAYYEKYSSSTKYKGEFADRALSDAVVLRLGLGQEDEAIKTANNFKKYFGSRKAAESAQIFFAIADYYGEKQAWDDVIKQLGGQGMRLIDQAATLDVKAQAHALLGRAYQALKRDTQARREYGIVAGYWKEPKKAVDMIGSGSPDQLRRLGRALDAVGEALFYAAQEAEAKKVSKLVFPEYKGQKDAAGINKHISTKVKDWYQKKSAAIKAVANEEYKQIIDLQPEPPPRWVIAAGSQVGAMWGQFVKDFRSAPIPKEWEKDYEIKTAYYGALDDASEPYKLGAKEAYQICLGYSVKYQYFDSYSRACEEWLAENYKSEFHLVDEFRPSPNQVNDPLKEQAYPVQIGGEPLSTAPPVPEEKKDKNDKETAKEQANK